MGAGTAVNPKYEIWDPDHPAAPLEQLPVGVSYLGRVKQNYYPFNYREWLTGLDSSGTACP